MSDFASIACAIPHQGWSALVGMLSFAFRTPALEASEPFDAAAAAALGVVHVPVHHRISLFETLGALLVVVMIVATAYSVLSSGRKEGH